MSLAKSDDPAVVQSLEAAAERAEDEAVRAAAKTALIVRDPPATGYLVTGTAPTHQAAAAGMRQGDVIVSYGGVATPTLEALGKARESEGGTDSVTVVVVRDGREVEIQLRPGRMGVYGMPVKARQ